MAEHYKMLLKNIQSEERDIIRQNKASYSRIYIGVAIYYLAGLAVYFLTISIATLDGATNMSRYGPP